MASKSNKPQPITATAIAKKAGCSRQLASRLLARGFDERQIVERVEERKRREAARTSARNKAATAVTSAPPSHSGPVNGFPYPPFAESEAKKEAALAELRSIEVARQKGELLPLAPILAVTTSVVKFEHDLLWLLPNEAAQELAGRSEQEIASILHRHVERIFAAVAAFGEGECRKFNIVLPPAPPTPTRSQLASYERFVKDSRVGEIEVTPLSERIDSKEWTEAHPSVTFEMGFAILRKKREWDRAMAELLNRRSEWDLPPERPHEEARE